MKSNLFTGIAAVLNSASTQAPKAKWGRVCAAMPVKAFFLFTLFQVTLMAGAFCAQAQSVFYVRAGASGANNGSNWADAYSNFPSDMKRGATYYVAAGSYGSRTFNTPTSGSTPIIIKKATSADHGTNAGWQSSYANQASFGRVVFSTDNWVFDGQHRNENDWSSQSSYGFRVAGGIGGNNAILINVSYVNNITLRYVFAHFDAVKSGDDVTANRDQGLYSLGSSRNITMERSAIKNTSYKAAILINNTSGPIRITHNWFENIARKELFSARGTDNVTFAYNKSKNVRGTGALVADDSDNWDIHGNWFWSPDSNYSFTDVIIGTWTGNHPNRTETLNNWKIYNNTFYQMHGATKIEIQKGSGNVVANNLFIGFSSAISGSITSSNNTQNASTSAVRNAGSGDFALSGPTAGGTTLSSPYNVDLLGNIRGANGNWDRGAFEYATAQYTPNAPNSPERLRIETQ